MRQLLALQAELEVGLNLRRDVDCYTDQFVYSVPIVAQIAAA